MFGNTEIKNSYYSNLSTLNKIGLVSGTGSLKTDTSSSKTLSEFKSSAATSTSVTYLLNLNETQSIWAQSDDINDGYPYLIDNEP